MVATAAVFFALYFWTEASELALPATTAILALLAVVGRMVTFTDSQTAAVGESRERLTRAEGALADAIRRGTLTGVDVIIGGSLTHSRDATPPLHSDSTMGDEHPPPAEIGRRAALGLPELWEATHARLDLYHQIATGQAKTSFRNAQIAMGAGFLLLILFAGIALWASTTAVAIVAGGLGAVSAALAGYVAKTFIRSQEAAATHLRSYFDQPLELSRYLAAERLVADGDLSQEQRGEILTALVQAMVAGPQPPPAPQSVVVASVPGQQGV
ncbi:hypothetical protein GCM10010253_42980 [Streptomyces badius]|uniref:SMODS and SLOG-associating 2TM effector domain-containing protein n=2 Tax=Streptomyces badius TaxID=1941 RepID=A0ABQ2TDE6_STRBA|nr:hypothetical protein GCM10010253_42980 [Streptomyces badius]